MYQRHNNEDLRNAVVAELPYLRRFARGLTSDFAAADDLVQDCVERALSKLHLYDESRNLRTWLYSILRNIFINGVRYKKRRGGIHASIEEIPEDKFAAEADQMSSLAVKEIASALNKLPEKHRELLVLICVEEVSYKEAADVLGVPVGTVMSRLNRARKAFEALMEQREKVRLRIVK